MGAVETFRSCIPLFQALSDPARQDIILLLAQEDSLSVNEIAEHSKLSRPAISHHLKILRDNKLVDIEQKGTQRHYSLALNSAVELLKELIVTVETTCDLGESKPS
ncbi:metalloregulator ArsR/SmtB family transcription factor [Paenibacillus sp. PL2-23]|uniref:ArsR/SmtB family transcription factor n=1 Tax=Paenibacillus sp. PL2-23 TaxID=2100729 RepID=UPI0030FC5549